jgi:NADH pyrophosphatase NudC (nudix superfamily)
MRWEDIKKHIKSLTPNEITAINRASDVICGSIKTNTCCFKLHKDYTTDGIEAWECSSCKNIYMTEEEFKYCPKCGLQILAYTLE